MPRSSCDPLRPPLLGISDGAQGLINAIETRFPRMHRQRCLIHRARNVLAKIPPEYQDTIKADYWQIFEDLTAPPGQAAVREVQSRIDAFAEQHRKSFPSAVKCLLADRAALTSYLHFPTQHWHRIRHRRRDRCRCHRSQQLRGVQLELGILVNCGNSGVGQCLGHGSCLSKLVGLVVEPQRF